MYEIFLRNQITHIYVFVVLPKINNHFNEQFKQTQKRIETLSSMQIIINN